MNAIQNVTMVFHIIASLVLIMVVLLQSGKAAGMSGSIAGGAETFFGKNKGRTIDAKLEKWTSVFAIVFLITCIILGLFVNRPAANVGEEPNATEQGEQQGMTQEERIAALDESFGAGNWMDSEDGNSVINPETGVILVDENGLTEEGEKAMYDHQYGVGTWEYDEDGNIIDIESGEILRNNTPQSMEEQYDSMFGEGNWSVDEDGNVSVNGGDMTVDSDGNLVPITSDAPDASEEPDTSATPGSSASPEPSATPEPIE